ncbi:MAG: gliding motility-associated C-terminal domain-containing protein [Chitinophagaceae bacterium]|nr:gliding motility-associated C-terminal domain-containing protein [Chitinophagaceae bacterium]MCW5926743.1 gliding motility-associated C-terminal domain-containing protein [Chitinophagaceae bacterium]
MKHCIHHLCRVCILLVVIGLQANATNVEYTGNPVSGRAEDPIINTINLVSGISTICHSTSPGLIMGTNPGDGIGSYTYQWQSSTTSASAGFSDIASGDIRDYTPGNLNVTTWYRRIVTTSEETSISNVIQITVIPATVDLVIHDPAAVCSPQTVDLTAAAIVAGSTPGLTFTYHNTAADTEEISNPSAIGSAVALDRNYYIKATNTCGDEDVKPVRVVINIPPDLSVTAPSAPVCKGAEVQLTAVSAGSSIEWQGLGAGEILNVNPQSTTSYTAIARSPEGCTSTETATVNVINFTMQLTANPSSISPGDPVTLTSSANAIHGVSAWLPESHFANQIATVQTITVTDTVKTFSVVGVSEEGCRDTASTTISVDVPISEGDTFIPNAFTPNGDGKNDIFKVYGSAIREVDIRIYNQWGNFIFETKDNTLGWDGTQKGRPQPVGVYLYVIKIRLNNEDSFIKKGSVSLIR